jgi:hypothetical protein
MKQFKARAPSSNGWKSMADLHAYIKPFDYTDVLTPENIARSAEPKAKICWWKGKSETKSLCAVVQSIQRAINYGNEKVRKKQVSVKRSQMVSQHT